MDISKSGLDISRDGDINYFKIQAVGKSRYLL